MADICREHGISEATYYIWKKKYSGLGLNELRELRQLREENGKLKHWSRICRWTGTSCRRSCKKSCRPRHRRELGRWTQTVFALSTRRVSGLMMINRSTMNHQSRRIRSTRCGCGCASWRRAGCVRLSTPDGAAQARGLGGEREAHLSALHRGRTCVRTKVRKKIARRHACRR